MRLIGFATGLLLTFSAVADDNPWPPIPATESELALITDRMGIESVDEATRSRILKIAGLRSHPPHAENEFLFGYLWMKPVLAHGGLCVLTQFRISAEITDSGFEWEDEPFVSYKNWLALERQTCEIEDPSDVEEELVTFEPIPSDSLIQIIEKEDRLIEAVLQHSDADERFRSNDYEWRVSEVRLPNLIDYDLGFPFTARLVSPSAGFGPAVKFSIEYGEFTVHSVGIWEY